MPGCTMRWTKEAPAHTAARRSPGALARVLPADSAADAYRCGCRWPEAVRPTALTQPAQGRPKAAERPLGGQERSDVGADISAYRLSQTLAHRLGNGQRLLRLEVGPHHGGTAGGVNDAGLVGALQRGIGVDGAAAHRAHVVPRQHVARVLELPDEVAEGVED